MKSFRKGLALAFGVIMLVGLLTLNAAAADLSGVSVIGERDSTGITATLSNNSTTSIDAYLILAVYDLNGRLLYDKDYSVTVDANTLKSQRFDYDIDAHPVYIYKLFAWNTISFAPLCEYTSVPVCEVRPITTPVPGHFPASVFKYPYKANLYNNTSTTASVGNGFNQTLTWEPAIDKTFLTDTEYTATLTLEPNAGWTNCGMPGTGVSARSFSLHGITPANIGGLPKVGDPGVKEITWEYTGAYTSGATTNPDANLIIHITFDATGSVEAAPDVIFYEDFSKGVHDDKTIGEGYFMMAQQANRQGLGNWRDAMTSVRQRIGGGSELVLGYKKDPSGTTSTDPYIKNNWITAGGVRTRGRTAAQGGGAYGLDDIIFENAFGYYEANIKFPQANVVWGAFWLFSPATAAPLTVAEGGSIYATEIDIIETAGFVGKSYNAAYHVYRNSEDRNQTTGPRRTASPNRELVYPDDPRWAAASRMAASEEVEISTSASRTGIDLYDGEFHKIALEWSPTDYIFYIDGYIIGSWQNVSSHYRSNGGTYSDWPWINQNEGVMQNPAYIKLTVEAAEWADETNDRTWRDNPDNPWFGNGRLGVYPDEGAMVVDYVYVLNGPKSGVADVDKTALQTRYDALKDTVDNDYSQTSWNTFQSTLISTKIALENPVAKQAEIDAALPVLNAAFDELTAALLDVRSIETPVAGHFPSSLYKYPYKPNLYNNTSTTASVGNGFSQTLTWEPEIEKTFLPNTEYTVTLTLEPNAGWSNCGMPGGTAISARSFSANNITPAHIDVLPTEGVKSMTWEYAGTYTSGSTTNQNANLIIHITFDKTGPEEVAPDIIFFEDFSKGVHDDKTIGEGYFMMAQQANRQGLGNWRDAMTSVRVRDDGKSELVLGYKKDPSGTTSTDPYIKNNWITAGGVRTRGRTDAQGGGAYGLDDIIFENAFGYYEANIKFPQANVVWGAFWLFSPATAAPLTVAEGGSKYATEIDIIETAGFVGKSYNAAYHVYRNSADRDQTTGPRRTASPNRELVYPDDPRWATASRMAASEEVEISTSASRTGIDLYDGEFHKIALEWSPTDYIFYIDGYIIGSWQNVSSHYRSNGGTYSDWPWINQNEGVMQNPAYIKLTVEAAEWADETNDRTWRDNPDNPWFGNGRLGVYPDEGAMVVDYVYVLNGPKPANFTID